MSTLAGYNPNVSLLPNVGGTIQPMSGGAGPNAVPVANNGLRNAVPAVNAVPVAVNAAAAASTNAVPVAVNANPAVNAVPVNAVPVAVNAVPVNAVPVNAVPVNAVPVAANANAVTTASSNTPTNEKSSKDITIFTTRLSLENPRKNPPNELTKNQEKALELFGLDGEAVSHADKLKILQGLFDGECNTDKPLIMLEQCEPIRRVVQSLAISLLERLSPEKKGNINALGEKPVVSYEKQADGNMKICMTLQHTQLQKLSEKVTKNKNKNKNKNKKNTESPSEETTTSPLLSTEENVVTTIGIKNPSVDCYCTSTVQMLYSIPQVRSLFNKRPCPPGFSEVSIQDATVESIKNDIQAKRKDSKDFFPYMNRSFLCSLKAAFQQLDKKRTTFDALDTLNTEGKEAVSDVYVQYLMKTYIAYRNITGKEVGAKETITTQQDQDEFLQFIFQVLKKDNNLKAIPALFGFRINQVEVVQNKTVEVDGEEDETILNVSLAGDKPSATPSLTVDKLIESSQKNATEKKTKSYTIDKENEYLLVYTDRFDDDRKRTERTLSGYSPIQFAHHDYTLFGAILYYPFSSEGNRGHYMYLRVDPKDPSKFVLYNDDKVGSTYTSFTLDDVKQECKIENCSYVLVYRVSSNLFKQFDMSFDDLLGLTSEDLHQRFATLNVEKKGRFQKAYERVYEQLKSKEGSVPKEQKDDAVAADAAVAAVAANVADAVVADAAVAAEEEAEEEEAAEEEAEEEEAAEEAEEEEAAEEDAEEAEAAEGAAIPKDAERAKGNKDIQNAMAVLKIEEPFASLNRKRIAKIARDLLAILHPNKGGDPEEYKKVASARDVLLNAVRNKVNNVVVAAEAAEAEEAAAEAEEEDDQAVAADVAAIADEADAEAAEAEEEDDVAAIAAEADAEAAEAVVEKQPEPEKEHVNEDRILAKRKKNAEVASLEQKLQTTLESIARTKSRVQTMKKKSKNKSKLNSMNQSLNSFKSKVNSLKNTLSKNKNKNNNNRQKGTRKNASNNIESIENKLRNMEHIITDSEKQIEFDTISKEISDLFKEINKSKKISRANNANVKLMTDLSGLTNIKTNGSQNKGVDMDENITRAKEIRTKMQAIYDALPQIPTVYVNLRNDLPESKNGEAGEINPAEIVQPAEAARAASTTTPTPNNVGSLIGIKTFKNGRPAGITSTANTIRARVNQRVPIPPSTPQPNSLRNRIGSRKRMQSSPGVVISTKKRNNSVREASATLSAVAAAATSNELKKKAKL